jgi:inorganic phosphate transporter, PiT family
MDIITLTLLGIISTLLLIYTAEFINGWTDAPNAIATVVATGAMPIKAAIAMAVVFNTIGAFFGTAVAATIGKGIVDAGVMTLPAIAGAMCAVIAWGSFAGVVGLPISKSHALLGGIAGAAVVSAGTFSVLIAAGWIKVGIGLVLSVFISLPAAFLIGWVIKKTCARLPPAPAERTFKRLMIVTAAWMGFGHGMNDAQKFVGIIVLVLTVTNAPEVYPSFAYLQTLGVVSPDSKTNVPVWVILSCALTMGAGTALGGRKIIEKVGKKVTQLNVWQGFAAQFTAASVLSVTGWAGIPISTTHTIVCSMLGAGASKSAHSVQWGQALKIGYAWLATFFICPVLGFMGAFVAIQLVGFLR